MKWDLARPFRCSLSLSCASISGDSSVLLGLWSGSVVVVVAVVVVVFVVVVVVVVVFVVVIVI